MNPFKSIIESIKRDITVKYISKFSDELIKRADLLSKSDQRESKSLFDDSLACNRILSRFMVDKAQNKYLSVGGIIAIKREKSDWQEFKNRQKTYSDLSYTGDIQSISL